MNSTFLWQAQRNCHLSGGSSFQGVHACETAVRTQTQAKMEWRWRIPDRWIIDGLLIKVSLALMPQYKSLWPWAPGFCLFKVINRLTTGNVLPFFQLWQENFTWYVSQLYSQVRTQNRGSECWKLNYWVSEWCFHTCHASNTPFSFLFLHPSISFSASPHAISTAAEGLSRWVAIRYHHAS